MFRNKFGKVAPIIILLNCLLVSMIAVAAEKISNPEELVAKHLESLGTSQARSDVKSRADEGTVQFRVLSGGTGYVDGKAVLLSEGPKLLLMISLPNNEYRGERFIFNGEKVEVRSATARQTLSNFGAFVHVQDVILREGLLGGALSTAWPLLNLQAHNPKLSYQGVKKVDGHEVHDLLYQPKRNSDLTIHLYFDTDDFRHVRTVYTASFEPHIGTLDTESPQHRETRYRLEERFSNFASADGLTLPTHYTIQYTEELENGHTVWSQWDTAVKAIKQNVSPDPRNFAVK